MQSRDARTRNSLLARYLIIIIIIIIFLFFFFIIMLTICTYHHNINPRILVVIFATIGKTKSQVSGPRF